MRLQTQRRIVPATHYRAPELHLIKGEPREASVETQGKRSARVSIQMPSERTKPISKKNVTLQTERRFERVPLSVLERHTGTADIHSVSSDPVEVHVDFIAEKPLATVTSAVKRHASVESDPINVFATKRRPVEKDPIAVHVDLTVPEQSVAGFVLLEQACKVQHLGNTYYSCPICRQVFVLLSDVTTHLMTHSPEDVRALQNSGHIDIKEEAPVQKNKASGTYYTCQMCNDIFMSLSDVQSHSRMHLTGIVSTPTPPTPSTTIIQRKKPLTVSLVEYTEEASRVQVRGKTGYSCMSCSLIFDTFSGLKQHLPVHAAGLPVVCALPPPVTAKAAEVTEKRKTFVEFTEESCQFKYRGQNYYSCPGCPKLFSTFPEVKKHALIHTDMTKKVAAKKVVLTASSVLKPSAVMSPAPPQQPGNVSSSAPTAQPVRTSQAVAQQCISIEQFTEQACQFVNGGRIYYSCLACPKIYATYPEVRKHALFHVAGRKKYNCHICLEGFDSHQHFKVHKLKHVPVEDLNCGECEQGLDHKPVKYTISGKKYECPICKQGFDVYHQLKHHRLKHVTEFRFKCVICDKGFKVNTQLQEHLKTHSTNKKYQCDLCDYRARSLFRIEHHKEDVHSTGSSCVCETCGKGFSNPRQLKNHKLMHRERNIKCPDCDKMFYSQTNLRSHQEVHNPSKDNVCSCEVCGQAFSKLSRLRSHIFRRHSEKSKYNCEFCDKVLSTPGSLTIHRRRHTGEKPFSCNVCNKTFISRTYLKVHMRVHTGEKPFKCDLCEKAFSQKSTLIIHKRYHSGLRPYACEVCPKSFVTKTLLTAHEKTHPL